MNRRLTLLSMSGLRVGHQPLLELGMRLPGLKRRAEAIADLPSLGLLTIAAVVPEHWKMELLSDDGGVAVEETVERVCDSRPDIVAFSTLTPAANRAESISRVLRKRGIKTVVGGLHATAVPAECASHFDAVVIGDGEPVFAGVIADYEAGKLQRRYKPSTPFDLAESPLPKWDLLSDKRVPRYTLQTMRGCPWACSFCAASRLLGPPRAKPIKRIEEELAAVTRRQQRPWLELADDNTFAVQRDFGPMLEALGRHRARWFTESDWRVGSDKRLLGQIARSGCRQILVGLESTVFRYPGMGNKAAELSEMTDAVRAIQEAGIVVNACFIIGADGETESSIERLGDFLETAPFGEIQLTLQTPFPGTVLYQQLQRSGRLLFDDWSRYTLFDVTYQPDVMSASQLQEFFNRLVARSFRAELQSRRDKIVREIRRRQSKVRRA